MSTPGPESRSYTPVAACEICSQLADVETSYVKYGRPEDTCLLPPAAARLQDVESHTTKRCPICGTYYSYSSSYDYFVNGAEEDERLTRLTPTQARRFLTEAEHARLIEAIAATLQDAHPLNRRYAARCLIAYDLERQESTFVEAYLLHPDREVSKSALFFLDQLSERGELLAGIARLAPVLEALQRSDDLQVLVIAQLVLERARAAKR